MRKGFGSTSSFGLVFLGTVLALWQPAQAGLLDKVIEGAPKRIELTPASDMVTAYQEAFTPGGLFAAAPAPVSNGSRKIAIAGFQVEFATEQKGVTPAQMQAATDRLYTAFVSVLRNRGYEVLPTGVLAGTAYKDALQKANQPPVPHERGTVLDLLVMPREKEVATASAHSVMGSGNYEVVAADGYEDVVTEDGTLALTLLAEAFAK